MRTTLYHPVEREGFGAANPEGGTGFVYTTQCKTIFTVTIFISHALGCTLQGLGYTLQGLQHKLQNGEKTFLLYFYNFFSALR